MISSEDILKTSANFAGVENMLIFLVYIRQLQTAIPSFGKL